MFLILLMVKTSAGLLMYRIKKENLVVFLIHPGGPFWKNKDLGEAFEKIGKYVPQISPSIALAAKFTNRGWTPYAAVFLFFWSQFP